MRRWLPLALLLVTPTMVSAQSGFIVGNTLFSTPPAESSMVMLANGKGSGGKGHGRGGGAPSPAPSAAPAPAPSFSDGRAESSYSFQQPLRVQIEGPTVTPHPVVTWPTTVVDVPRYEVQPTGSGAGWLVVPVQFSRAVATQSPQGRVAAPTCPIGCEPTPLPQRPAPMLCNAAGQCIPWP